MDHVDGILAQWQSERPDLNVSAMGVIGRIKKLSQYLSREMEKTFAQHGLNAAGFDVLATLRRAGEPYSLSPGQLLEQTMVTSGTMTHRIDLLVKAGWVERVKNPNDARSVQISLTHKGYNVINAAISEHVATQQRLLAGLSKDEAETLTTLLRKFVSGFEDS